MTRILIKGDEMGKCLRTNQTFILNIFFLLNSFHNIFNNSQIVYISYFLLLSSVSFFPFSVFRFFFLFLFLYLFFPPF